MHTPDEAKELWCPMIRNGQNNAFLENNKPVLLNHCVVHVCMMWRWAQKPNPDYRHDSAFAQYPPRDIRNDPPMYIEDRTRGYCGLAGRP